jgi:hypothetical protein
VGVLEKFMWGSTTTKYWQSKRSRLNKTPTLSNSLKENSSLISR